MLDSSVMPPYQDYHRSETSEVESSQGGLGESSSTSLIRASGSSQERFLSGHFHFFLFSENFPAVVL